MLQLPWCVLVCLQCLHARGASVFPRKEKGKMMDEKALLGLFSPERVANIKKHCLSKGEWKFDKYEPTRVLYEVLLEEEFENGRILAPVCCMHMLVILQVSILRADMIS